MSTTNRKNARLPSRFYIGTGKYLVTVCTAQRRRSFVSKDLSQAAIEVLRNVGTDTAFLIHAYCVMPDHVHVLVEGTASNSSLQKFVSRWKQITGFRFRDRTGVDLWQKGYFDCVLRRSGDVDPVAWYVWMNPVRAGIVHRPEEYSYSGSFTVPWPVTTRIANDAWMPPWKRKCECRVRERSIR